jgi:ribosomal-protein-alanine N-acetyltransferase
VVVIRRAQRADVVAIYQMEQFFPSDRMSVATIRRFLQVPSAVVWVAQIEKKIVGSLVLLTRRNSRTARIYSVVVTHAARGRGVAQKLVGAAEIHVGKDKAFMSLEVRQDNVAARALYRKLGYAEVKTLPGFYEDGSDGLRLSKHLNLSPAKTV